MLSLQSEKHGDTQILRLRGELDLANAEPVETALSDALANGQCRVVVDMRELEFIDSTGIAILVAALGSAGEDGKLCFIPSRAQAVSRILQLTGIGERMPLAEGSLDGKALSSDVG